MYAQRKHLIINTAKSEVVHFNSSGPYVPVLCVGGVPLVHKECFKYLGMMFHKHMNMAKSFEHAAAPFTRLLARLGSLFRTNLSQAGRMCPFVRQNLCDTSWHVWRPGVGH